MLLSAYQDLLQKNLISKDKRPDRDTTGIPLMMYSTDSTKAPTTWMFYGYNLKVYHIISPEVLLMSSNLSQHVLKPGSKKPQHKQIIDFGKDLILHSTTLFRMESHSTI
jgi:hypothetical protein